MEHIFKEIRNINNIAIRLAMLESDDPVTHEYYSNLCDEIWTVLYDYNTLLVYAKAIMEAIENGLSSDSDEITQEMTRAFAFRTAKRFLKEYNKMNRVQNDTN